jgi:cysteine desulfurase
VFHTDAVQWFGKEPVAATGFRGGPVSGCAHKLYGPKGAGVSCSLALAGTRAPGRKSGKRAPRGTENLAAIAGLVTAWEKFGAGPVMPRQRLQPLCSQLERHCLSLDGVRRWGLDERLANTLAVTVAGCDSLSLLAGLDLAGVCVERFRLCRRLISPPMCCPRSALRQRGGGGLGAFSLGRDTTRARKRRSPRGCFPKWYNVRN